MNKMIDFVFNIFYLMFLYKLLVIKNLIQRYTIEIKNKINFYQIWININLRYARIKNLEGFVKRKHKEFNILIFISETFKVWVMCINRVNINLKYFQR